MHSTTILLKAEKKKGRARGREGGRKKRRKERRKEGNKVRQRGKRGRIQPDIRVFHEINYTSPCLWSGCRPFQPTPCSPSPSSLDSSSSLAYAVLSPHAGLLWVLDGFCLLIHIQSPPLFTLLHALEKLTSLGHMNRLLCLVISSRVPQDGRERFVERSLLASFWPGAVGGLSLSAESHSCCQEALSTQPVSVGPMTTPSSCLYRPRLKMTPHCC